MTWNTSTPTNTAAGTPADGLTDTHRTAFLYLISFSFLLLFSFAMFSNMSQKVMETSTLYRIYSCSSLILCDWILEHRHLTLKKDRCSSLCGRHFVINHLLWKLLYFIQFQYLSLWWPTLCITKPVWCRYNVVSFLLNRYNTQPITRKCRRGYGVSFVITNSDVFSLSVSIELYTTIPCYHAPRYNGTRLHTQCYRRRSINPVYYKPSIYVCSC